MTEIPEKEAMAPEVIIAPKPPISPHEKTPAVTSKNPEKTAFKNGDERTEKVIPEKAISRTPQEIMMNAHIRKQLSAAEMIDSTAQEALLFLGTEKPDEEICGAFEKAEMTAAIIKADKNCAAKRTKPIFKLPKTPVPIAPIRKEGPALTQ